ncbi:MAG: diguanylate cyclase [Gammaproteobacteria bacterium]
MKATILQAKELEPELHVAGVVLLFLLLCTAVQYAPLPWPAAVREVLGTGLAVLPVRWAVAAASLVAMVRQWGTPLRAPLGLLAAAMTFGALASSSFYLGGDGPTWEQVQRLCILITYTCLAAAVLALPARPESDRDPVLLGLDFLLAGGVGILLVWFYFIQPGGDDSLSLMGVGGFRELLARLGYPALDVVLLLVLLIRPRMHRSGALRRVFTPMTLGIALVLAGDTLTMLRPLLPAWPLEGTASIVHRMAPVAFLLASLRSWRPLAEWSPAQPVAAGRRLWTTGSVAVALLLLALYLEQLDHGHPHSFTLTVGATAAGLLLLLRQSVLQRRRDSLVARQRQELERKVAERTAELAAAKSRLELLASEDALTGLPNRRAFDDALATAWSSCARARQPLSIALLDIDHFKAYNDHFGHPQGDSCLREVARVLQRVVRRRTDLVARYGGEEFLLLMPQTDAEGALLFAERVREAIEARGLAHAPGLPRPVVTVSIGVVTTAPDPVSMPEALFFAADAALYEAKAEGRNCVRSGRV